MYAQLTTHIKGDLSAQKASIFWRATAPRCKAFVDAFCAENVSTGDPEENVVSCK